MKKSMKWIITAMLALLAGGQAMAANINTITGANGYYNDPSIWVGGVMPANTNSAYIVSNSTVTVTGDWTVAVIRTAAGTAAGAGGSTLTQTAGNVNATTEFSMGRTPGAANSTANLNGGTFTTPLAEIGYDTMATLNIGGGNLVSAYTYVGGGAEEIVSGTGTVNMTSGTISGTALNLGHRTNATMVSYGEVYQSGGTINLTGSTAQLGISKGTGVNGEGIAAPSAVYHLSDGTINTHKLMIGENGGNGVLEMTGGAINIDNVSGSFLAIGHGSGDIGKGVINQSGGTITFTNNITRFARSVGAGGSGEWNLSSNGVADLGAVTLSDTATGSGTFNISAGGRAIVSNISGTAVSTQNILTFDGANLGARANSTAFIATNVSTEIKAHGVNIDNNGFTITIAANMTGAGALTNMDIGELILTGSNSYTGGTYVAEGTLNGAAANAFGTGGMTVAAGATLILGNNSAINDLADLVLGSTSALEMNFTGQETVYKLSLDGGNTYVAIGTYDAAQLDALGDGTYTGTGIINVTAVPEPATVSLFVISSVGLFIFRRLR